MILENLRREIEAKSGKGIEREIANLISNDEVYVAFTQGNIKVSIGQFSSYPITNELHHIRELHFGKNCPKLIVQYIDRYANFGKKLIEIFKK